MFDDFALRSASGLTAVDTGSAVDPKRQDVGSVFWQSWRCGGFAGLVVLLLSCGHADFLLAQDQVENAFLLQEIQDAWVVQANEIQTARLKMQHINRLAKEPADWNGVMAAFDELARVAENADSETVARAVKSCVTAVAGPDNSPEWPKLTIVVDGQDVRNTIEIGGEVRQDWGYRDGQSVLYFSGFREAQVESGRSIDARFDMRYVRPVLQPDPCWTLQPSTGDGEFWMECDGGAIKSRALVDPKTKILRRFYAEGASAGFRGGLAEFAGGVLIPSFGIDVGGMGKNGRVRTIDAFIIEHAEFNRPLDVDEAAVSVPPETRIVDKREASHMRVGTAKRSGDPVELANELKVAKSKQESGDSTWRVLLSITALLLGTGLALAGVRRFLAEKKTDR